MKAEAVIASAFVIVFRLVGARVAAKKNNPFKGGCVFFLKIYFIFFY